MLACGQPVSGKALPKQITNRLNHAKPSNPPFPPPRSGFVQRNRWSQGDHACLFSRRISGWRESQAAWLSSWSLEQSGPMKQHLGDFDGKVVSVVCKNENTCQLIRSPRFQKLGGRLFIVGTVPEDASQDPESVFDATALSKLVGAAYTDMKDRVRAESLRASFR
jgi:hypothetical protein